METALVSATAEVQVSMSVNTPEIGHLLQECATVQENCLYTAQAHFETANAATWRVRLLVIIPSCVAALAGILTAVGLPGWIGAFAAASGLVSAIAAALGADRKSSYHCQAGNVLTALRHEARALCATYSQDLTREQLAVEVRRINDRYNALIQALETPDPKAFQKARKRIKAGVFKSDATGSEPKIKLKAGTNG